MTAFLDPADIRVGASLPELTFGPITRLMLALYAGASGDHNPVHVDSDAAHAAGLPDVFAHGMLSFGVLSRAVTEWAGVGRVRRIRCRFSAMTQVHDDIVVKATVSERLMLDAEDCVRLSIAASTTDGRQTLKGEAWVTLEQERSHC